MSNPGRDTLICISMQSGSVAQLLLTVKRSAEQKETEELRGRHFGVKVAEPVYILTCSWFTTWISWRDLSNQVLISGNRHCFELFKCTSLGLWALKAEHHSVQSRVSHSVETWWRHIWSLQDILSVVSWILEIFYASIYGENVFNYIQENTELRNNLLYTFVHLLFWEVTS